MNIRILIVSLSVLVSCSGVMAQTDGVLIDYVGSTRDNSAVLDVRSANQGLMVPRVALTTGTASAAPVTSPAASLLIYNTATVGDVTPGYYYWNVTGWVRLVASNATPGTVTSIATNNGITGGTITASGTIGLTGQALALHNLASNGFIYRNGTTIGARTLTAGTGISITNGTGVSGDPTISLTNVGTAGTYRSVTTDAQGRVTAGTNPTTLAGYGITDAVPSSRTITLNSTANQTTVSATAQDLSANRTWTIGTVQDIATTSSPTFNNVTATGRFFGGLNVPDTRAVNSPPTSYDNEVRFDFKQLSVLNSAPGSGTFGGLMTFAPWSDDSGDASHQLLFNEGGIYWRQGQPNAATWDSWSQVLTTAAGGGGTTNYLARWTSANTLGIGATFDNGTNVGINEAAPNAPLSIRASNTSDQGLYQSWRYQANSDTYTLRLKQTVTSGVVRYTYDMVNNSTAYNNFLTFDRGNIGMGVTDPLAKLHVRGGKLFLNQLANNPQTANYAAADLVIGDNTTTRNGYGGTNGSHIFLQSINKSSITALDEGNNLGQISYQNLQWTIGEEIGWGTQSVKLPNLAGTGNRPVYADATGILNTNSAGAAAGAATVVPLPVFGDEPIVSTTTWTRITMTSYSGIAAYFSGVPIPAGATRKYFLVIRRADNQPGGIGSYWRFACDGGWNSGNDVAGHGFSLSSNWGSTVEGTMDWIEIPPTAVSGAGCGTAYWKIDARMANAGQTMRVMSVSMAAMDVYGGTNAAYALANSGNAIGPRTSTDFGYSPLGSIIAWHKNLSSTPGLPDGWVECNGQTISDAMSPYNGVAVPNLNSNVTSTFGGTSGGGRFLRGATTSGTMQADQMADIEMNGDASSSSTSLTRNNDGSTSNYSAWFEYYYAGDRMRWRYANREVRPVAMTVVWIIRVK